MTAILKNPNERARFFKFAIVGAIGTVMDFGIMNLLVTLAHLTLVTAGTISFICAVISNFTWNRFWTYPESRSKHLVGQLGQFGLVNAMGLLIRYPILKFGEPLLDQLVTNLVKFTSISHQFFSHNLTLASAIGIVMLWNYFANRHWTYNDIDKLVLDNIYARSDYLVSHKREHFLDNPVQEMLPFKIGSPGDVLA